MNEIKLTKETLDRICKITMLNEEKGLIIGTITQNNSVIVSCSFAMYQQNALGKEYKGVSVFPLKKFFSKKRAIEYCKWISEDLSRIPKNIQNEIFNATNGFYLPNSVSSLNTLFYKKEAASK